MAKWLEIIRNCNSVIEIARRVPIDALMRIYLDVNLDSATREKVRHAIWFAI